MSEKQPVERRTHKVKIRSIFTIDVPVDLSLKEAHQYVLSKLHNELKTTHTSLLIDK